jgi:putative ABC transport system permease protein
VKSAAPAAATERVCARSLRKKTVTLLNLIAQSARYYWRTNLAITLGVAAAVSVLAGALVVGDSVRGSLRDIALSRIGRTDRVLTSAGFFREGLAGDMHSALGAADAVPLVVANAYVTLESSGRRASGVVVYGVDERFWRFHGQTPPEGVTVSPALWSELGAKEGDVLLTRLQRPSEIPSESLFGRKEDVGRTVRLTLAGMQPRDRLGEFALRPQQADVRAVFAPLRRIQRDLAVNGQVNTLLIAGGHGSDSGLKSALQLEDLGVRVTAVPGSDAVAIESASGILTDALEGAIRKAAEKLGVTPVPVFTYLANTIRKGDRQIPYSLIAATDLRLLPKDAQLKLRPSTSSGRPEPVEGRAPLSASEPQAPGSKPAAPGPRPPASDALVLNEWAARELQAAAGDRIDIDYYLWDPTAGLETRSASFTLERVVPIAGLAADRRLAPDYPGITDTRSLAEWDPPFPIDLSRVRPADERYWDEYRATPKAFIPYDRGRDLWQSRYGAMTSIRVAAPDSARASELASNMAAELRKTLSPQAMGIALAPARATALEASRGATDFGEYFTYFSFFLVVSALLLAVLFFKLGVEQRLRQLGILRAAGYTIRTLRRLLLGEALVLAVIGGILGVAGAIAYGRLIVHGLGTWWVGAVGTTLLGLHIRPVSLALGAAGGVVAAVLCVVLSLRTVGRLSPRALLTAQALDAAVADVRGARKRQRLATVCALAGAALLALGFIAPAFQAGAFFGAGAALLVGFLLWLAGWLRARDTRAITGRGSWAIARLGFRSAAFRPARSVLSAALIASATFIIVSVDAFRRDSTDMTTDRRSGTGGFVLLAKSELPLLYNPNEKAGREALMLQAPELARTRFTRFRVRQGEDASCLNLYRPSAPTIIAPEAGFIESGRFAFASSLAGSDAERANPWLLLRRQFDDGSVPVVADATSLQYVLHAGVGDTWSIDTGADRPLILRFVAALRDSVLQGELVMAEDRFVTLFPHEQGYRLFFVDDPEVHTVAEADALAGVVERELRPLGVDAVPTSVRLAEFHRVENTYLSTFQALGGLGLLLGTIGLATVMFRNVLERRRELALLRAVGYDARNVTTMVIAEAAFLLCAGLVAGVTCAVIAILPAWIARGTLPGAGLVALLFAVAVAGLLSSMIATKAALSGNILGALRAE